MMKVSIITVSYNSAATIEQTIQSVVGQSYDNIEYIIIDGGSTDGTLDIIRKYEDQIVYWVSESDAGIYDAMNKGIRVATGDLVGFINSDDWYADGAIAAVANHYVTTQADVIYGDITFMDGAVQRLKKYNKLNLATLYYKMCMCHQAVFIKTRVQKKYLFDCQYQIASDYKVLLSLYQSGFSFSYIEQNIAFFRTGGVSTQFQYLMAREHRDVAMEVLSQQEELQKKYMGYIQKEYYKSFMLSVLYFVLYRLQKLLVGVKSPYVSCINARCLIFGTGDVGDLCYQCLSLLGVPVIGFIDNDTCKQDKEIHHIKIFSLHEALTMDFTTILIATNIYNDEIREQLNQIGLIHKVQYLDFYDWVILLARWYGKYILQIRPKNNY
jgi:glycosyltransferase involved in cell wall biosynthesis